MKTANEAISLARKHNLGQVCKASRLVWVNRVAINILHLYTLHPCKPTIIRSPENIRFRKH